MTEAEAAELESDTRKIAESLIGTAESIQYAINRAGLADKYDNETDLNWAVFDSVVFECSMCNWWCSADECNDCHGEWFCDDCCTR